MEAIKFEDLEASQLQNYEDVSVEELKYAYWVIHSVINELKCFNHELELSYEEIKWLGSLDYNIRELRTLHKFLTKREEDDL